MSVDRSLKSRYGLSRHRNVLTRTERISILSDDGRWDEEKDSVFGLPKVVHRKTSVGKKTKKPTADQGEAGETGESPEAGTEETSEKSSTD